ncbi:MAG: histidinol-phosphate transaminase [Moraxellaceae bacterium]|jgi:histidinol-phosphate aminotransferase|nr:histidinol-phosphate transaminase [Moraxellaceae bacterium]MBP7230085.1 histidinol-phosphate transaminase [Moraxellaceae bacterium]MBP8852396.1 histidinol-phosphate transaminase [Moraxellaceae bacterium]MBP9045968.1 histidinol-phosphate transaminase [Moraxellaceae bacterium]MBP9731186.1 histidinol-phosphate transaminase [Moraxellaceae bacterium]
MACDFIALATPGVQKISPYQPGKPTEELERELGIHDIIKLASNENPLGCSPRVLRAIDSGLIELSLYPDGNGFVLKQALANFYQRPLAEITLGNGSNDILELIGRAFLKPGDEAIYAQHSFAVYPLVVQAVGATGITVPAVNWGHDLVAMAKAITAKTRVIFIANPNNPTGTWVEKDALDAFFKVVPENVLVVLDEAYGEYVDTSDFPDGIDYLDRYPNVIVSRTFSKAYGLAGLRVGYAFAHPDITNVLNRVRQPFNVNSLALRAAVAALADQDFVSRSRTLNSIGMKQITEGVQVMGLSVIPSRGNFLCVHLKQAGLPVYDALLRQGVIVRPVTNYGMPDYLRVTIGTHGQNERFLSALKAVL